MKEKILEILQSIINERIINAKASMDAAQESANSEDKSSAGDKYETSRAMGQIDRDMYARQMVNAQNEMAALNRINIAIRSISVGLGCLVDTSAGYFFISVSVGKIDFEKKTLLAVSPSSPIGTIIMSKKVGEKFVFLGKEHKILAIN